MGNLTANGSENRGNGNHEGTNLASTSATRLAGTEINRWPLVPLSDRRVTFIYVSLYSCCIYSIAYIHQKKRQIPTPLLFVCIYNLWYNISTGECPPLRRGT